MAAYPAHHGSLPPTDSLSVGYSENEEEEIDQLDSDVEENEEIPVGESSSPKNKKSRRRSGERLPGQTLLPSSKLETILQADGATTNHLSKEAMFMLSIATEEFIKKLALAGHRESTAERRNSVTYNDLAAATQQYQEFMFLQDTIPQPLTVADAFERRAAKEKAQLEDNPAIASGSTYIPSFVTPSGLALTNAQKGKGKSKATTNGKAKVNGSGTNGTVRSRQRDKHGRYSNGGDEAMEFAEETNGTSGSPRRKSRTSREDGDEAEQPGLQMYPIDANGFQQATHSPWPAMQQPSDSNSSPHQDGHWSPQHYLGPASGFLQDHRLPFGTENPGRTIYSQR